MLRVRSTWDDRIKRAKELGEQFSFASELLSFYGQVVTFQKDLHADLSRALKGQGLDQDHSCPMHGGSLAGHLPLLLTFFPSILSIAKRAGPDELSVLAAEIQKATQTEWASLLESFWRKELDPGEDNLALLFFPKAFLQPYAELIADDHTSDFSGQGEGGEVEEGAGPTCPLCGSRPQVAVLRPEGEGAKRMLLCSVCSTEWRFKRVCCPGCGEEAFSKLPYHKASDFPHVRVEACESCHKYIKGVDLTTSGLAVPVVDEIAAVPLDIWAVEQGYTKIELNLVGV